MYRLCAMTVLSTGLLGFILCHATNADGPTPVPSGATLQSRVLADDPATPENFPDKYAWMLFVQVNQKAARQVHINGHPNQPMTNNALWETWPDDPWTFPAKPVPSRPPKWPQDAEMEKELSVNGFSSAIHGRAVTPAEKGADVSKVTPGGVKAPNGSGVGEEVRRNRSTFDYIIENNLWYQQGVVAFFQNAAAEADSPDKFAALQVNFPVDSVEVKGNWIVITEDQKSSFHWNYNSDGQLLGLVAMHISSKALPNWFWATFEHEDNPGLGDYIGIHDTFGAIPAHTPSNNDELNQTYPPTAMRPDLLRLFTDNGLNGDWGAQWKHYRLKGSQVAYTDQAGRPLLLGNSVTEAGFVPTASCITCHSRAAVDSTGANSFPMFGEKKSLPLVNVPQKGSEGSQSTTFITYNGTPDPTWYFQFSGANGTQLINLQTDFVWAIPFHAKPAVTGKQSQQNP